MDMNPKTETYLEMKERHRRETNALPIELPSAINNSIGQRQNLEHKIVANWQRLALVPLFAKVTRI